MQFISTDIEGVCIVEPRLLQDERGYFTRAFCAEEFRAAGLPAEFVQCNLSMSHNKGTLRGIHYQQPPAAEAKFVRCVQGAIYDVAVDLRETSPTYLQHVGVELSAANGLALFIPDYCAHGYQTLTDNAMVYYHVSAPYTPECEAGMRFDDPALDITWPLQARDVSAKDTQWPLLEDGLNTP